MNCRNFSDQLEAELPHLRRYALSLTRDSEKADDLVQDCIVRALSRTQQYRDGTHLRRWLFTILRNINIDGHRRIARRGIHVPVEDHANDVKQPPSQEDHMELRQVDEKIGELRPCDRKILYLSVFTDLAQDQIAKRMEIPVGTVKSRLSRARQQLAA